MKDPRIEELLDAYGSACTYYGIQVANPNGDNVERAERLKDEAKAKVIAQIEYGMLGQQSDAWSALWKLLSELVPNFWEAKGTGCEKALAAIRQLADKAAKPEPAWVANKAAFDAMEDGQGPYMHRKNLEGGVPVEWPAFKNWAENKLGQGYSLACCEGALVDSVTSWCFTGFQAGMEYAYETSRPAPDVWQPIETAPKDGTKFIAFCPGLGVIAPTYWDDNRFNKKPRPFWTHWGERIWGTRWIRDDQPTHWMPLPAAPKQDQP